MNSGFTVLLMVLGIAVSGRAYAQDVGPGRPGVVEVTIIPGGTLFTRLTALSVEAHVFPERLCEDLPEVGSEVESDPEPDSEPDPQPVPEPDPDSDPRGQNRAGAEDQRRSWSSSQRFRSRQPP